MQTSSNSNRKGITALSIVFVGIVLAFTLVGCGSGNSGSASASAVSASASAASSSASTTASASASASTASSASASASTASSSSASAESASASAASANVVKYASLEDFLSTEQGMQELQSTVNTAAFEQFGTIDVAVSNNDLVFTVTAAQALDKDPIDKDTISGEVEKALAQGIAGIEETVGVDDATIQFVIKDSTGKEWHTVTFNDQGMVK